MILNIRHVEKLLFRCKFAPNCGINCFHFQFSEESMKRTITLFALAAVMALGFAQAALADAPKFHLGAVYVIADDFDGMCEWYRDTFGFSEVHFDPSVPIRVFTLQGGFPFAVISAEGIEHSLASPRTNAVVFDFSVSDCAEAFEWAVSQGATAYLEPTPMPGITLAVIGDPEGNEIWIIEWSAETMAAHEEAMATQSGDVSSCECGSMCGCAHCTGDAEECDCG